MTQLIDNFKRRFRYLRLSVTEVCNFRCQYCLPNGYCATQKPSFLSLAEIERLTQAFTKLGVKKIRITGGEPTLRRDFNEILQILHNNQCIDEIALTTNGYRLNQDIAKWQAHGLTALNVSVDSLDPDVFYRLTGQNQLPSILKGLEKAQQLGVATIKVNVVLMKNVNDVLEPYLNWIKDTPIQLRFIELMETGQGREFFQRHHLSGQYIKQTLLNAGWQQLAPKPDAGPAQVFSHPNYQGEIGLIMPYEKTFCQSCNRLRVSSIGQLHLCLFGNTGVDLRDLLQDDHDAKALQTRIIQALQQKRETHFLHQHDTGLTQNLSFIGG